MGKTFVRRVLSGCYGTPKKVIVLSRDEAKQHEMRMDYLHKRVATDEVIYRNFNNVLVFRIGDVRSYSDICAAVKDVDIVVNAAALKQVPTCEYFPVQAVLTNCMGAANIVRAIEENGYPVETVVGISTDKACKPVNVMGMTKSVQERIFTAANIPMPRTRFICVRYGNVLASRGSVIPLFISQIKNGGPVTVTVPEMTRFLITLDEAVDTVMAAIEQGDPGDTFIPVAPSATVINIAKALVGDRNIEITITGIRPGEKMHEVLISEEEANHCTRKGSYYAISAMLPELTNGKRFDSDLLKGEYSSGDEVLDLDGTIALLKRHELTVEDVRLSSTGELLK
jgi:UDP-glucose 4-epimerase